MASPPDDFLIPIEMQGFVKTAGAIYKKIQDGVFDVSNEVIFQMSSHSVGLISEK